MVKGGATYISSSGIAAKVITDLGWLGNRETRVVISILVFEDLAMVVYLPVLTSILADVSFVSGLTTVGVALAVVSVVRSKVISDELWTVIEPVLPIAQSRPGRPWNDHRLTLEGICWRFRTGSPWRDLPAVFGAWQSVWERHRRWSADGSYERMFAAVKESTGVNDTELQSLLSVDSSSVRAHQHAAGAPKLKADPGHTRGQGRVTSFCPVSLLITPLDAPEAG